MKVITKQAKEIEKKYGTAGTGVLFERVIKTRLTLTQIYNAILLAEEVAENNHNGK